MSELNKTTTKRAKIGTKEVTKSYKNILNWLFDNDDAKPIALSGMNTIVFKEVFNANKLAYLILHPEVLPKREGARDLVPLDSYLNNASHVSVDGESFIQVKYKQCAAKLGRVYSHNTAQGMLREARYVIFDGIYNDFDLKNAHPVLLSQLLKALEVEHPCLEKYIQNRDECLQAMMDVGLTRDEAKRKYIMAIYGAGDASLTESACSPEFIEYVREMRGIAEFLRERFAAISYRIEAHKKKQANKGFGRPATYDNPLDGSILSYICQHMEVNVLGLMFKTLKKVSKAGAGKCILQHDGLMIPVEVDAELWMDMCKDAFYEHGFEAAIELKPFDKIELPGFDPKIDYLAEIDRLGDKAVAITNAFDDEEYYHQDFIMGLLRVSDETQSADQVKQYIIQNFDRVCKIVGDNSFYVKTPNGIEDSTGMPSVWSNFGVFSYVGGCPIRVSFDRYFKEHYRMFPHLHGINPLWNDSSNRKLLQLKPAFVANRLGERDMAKLEIFKKHTLEVICAGDMDNYMFLMQWLAHCFYRPNIKSQKIIIIDGGQGSGKSLWFNIISRSLFGSQVCLENVQGLQGLLDKDNYRFLNKKLLCVNELIQWEGNTASNLGRLKDFITEDEISVKKMYCNVRVEKAYYELIGLSNHDDVIRLEQSDRRFFMLKTDDKYIGDTEYFKALHSCMSCPELGNALAYELKAHLVDGFEQIRPPMTSTKREVLEISSGYIREFTQDVIEAGEDGLYDEYFPDKNGWFAKLEDLYNRYCKENGYQPRNWRFGARKSLENIGWTFKKTKTSRLSKPPATIDSA